MAIHAPITGAQSRAPANLAAAIRRATIEAEIEASLDHVSVLLARLDRDDGDCDLEDDDPAGDPLDIDGEAPTGDGRALSPVLPVWAIDQRCEPINSREPTRQRMVAELGLVRSPTGGWRLPA
jgi:hypothetical protein